MLLYNCGLESQRAQYLGGTVKSDWFGDSSMHFAEMRNTVFDANGKIIKVGCNQCSSIYCHWREG